MPEFYRRLRHQRRMLQLVSLFAFGFAVVAAIAGFILLLEAWNGYQPVQEQTAFTVVFGTFFGQLILLGAGLVFFLFVRPSLKKISRWVEEAQPELKDSLSAAVEVVERGVNSDMALEAALLRQVEQDTANLNLTKIVIPRRIHPLLFIGLGIAMALLSDGAARADVVRKAMAHYQDLVAGEATGLVVQPGNVEVPIGSDVDLTATISRWERDAVAVYEEAGEWVEYPMTLGPDGVARLTLFGVVEDIQYKVKTSSLQSEFFTVNTFQPPELESVSVQITPPEYTREAPQAFSRLLDLNVPEGSRIEFLTTTAEGISTVFSFEGSYQPFVDQYALSATESGVYQIFMTNSEGREGVTPRFQLEVLPDEKPVVEFVEPGRDTKADITDAVPLELFVADDYGVSRVELHVSVSGMPRPTVTIFSESSLDDQPLEKAVFDVLELQQQFVEQGDVVSYFATVYDNKTPEPQAVRSEVFFIEIMPDMPEAPQQDGSESEGQQQEETEVDFRAMIVELKRLIRQTYATVPMAGAERAVNRQDLGAGLSALKNELSGLKDLVLEMETMRAMSLMASGVEPPEPGTAYSPGLELADVVNGLANAESEVNEDRVENAIPFEEAALSKLIKLEAYFTQDQPPSQSSASSSSQQPSQGQQSESEQEQESQSESEQMGVAEMRENLESLNDLIDRQSRLEQQIERADRLGASEQEREQMQEEQLNTRREALSLGQQLRQSENTRSAGGQLQDAGREMSSASSAIGADDMAKAGRSAARAKQSLMEAASGLEGMIREAASQAVGRLAAQAGSLAERQQEAAGQSELAGAGDLPPQEQEQLRSDQAAIREDFQRFQNEMESTASELEGVFPEASEALEEIARATEQQRTESTMSRAENALLYERFGRAGREQAKAAEEVAQVADALNQAARDLPLMTPSQIENLLREVEQMREQLAQQQAAESAQSEPGEGEQPGETGEQPGEGEQPGQGEQAGTEAGESGSERTGQLDQEARQGRRLGGEVEATGRALRDEELARLGSEMKAPRTGETASTAAEMQSRLERASQLLRGHLLEEWKQDRARLNREVTPPPEKYRRQVEQYFRGLAEDSDSATVQEQ